jgi:hypothetical protein
VLSLWADGQAGRVREESITRARAAYTHRTPRDGAALCGSNGKGTFPLPYVRLGKHHLGSGRECLRRVLHHWSLSAPLVSPSLANTRDPAPVTEPWPSWASRRQTPWNCLAWRRVASSLVTTSRAGRGRSRRSSGWRACWTRNRIAKWPSYGTITVQSPVTKRELNAVSLCKLKRGGGSGLVARLVFKTS